MHEQARTKLNCRRYCAPVRGCGFPFFHPEERAGDGGSTSTKQAVSPMTEVALGAKKNDVTEQMHIHLTAREKNKKKGACV